MHEFLNLKIHYKHQNRIIIGLYDGSGKFLKTVLKDDISNKRVKNYNLPFNYSVGIYLLNIHSNLGRQSIKFTKKLDTKNPFRN